jgi:hypothetical protein
MGGGKCIDTPLVKTLRMEMGSPKKIANPNSLRLGLGWPPCPWRELRKRRVGLYRMHCTFGLLQVVMHMHRCWESEFWGMDVAMIRGRLSQLNDVK